MCLISGLTKLLLILSCFCLSQAYGLNAAFTSNVVSGCAPLVVDFTDNSTGGPISWDYDFGDGGSSTAQNPRYTFTKPGKYTIKLTVFDGSSYSSAKLTIVVWKLPTADFKLTKFEYCPGDVINFLNATAQGDTTIQSTSWDFGDGNVSSSNGNVSKSYNNSGNYTVRMTVRDNHNCASSISKSNFVTIYSKPTPVFSYNAKYSCIAPQRVNFTNNSGNSVSYLWDLGDGTTSTQATPVVFYNDAKNYVIKLTATSDKGCVATQTQTLVVQFGKIKADFSADAFTGCIPYNPKFKNNTQPVGVKLDYAWDFGDGTKSTLENPSKTYSKIGNYKVKLRASGSGAGCTDSIVKTLLVSDKPKASLSQTDTLACEGTLKAVFKAKSASTISNYTWFIDGKNIDTKVDSLEYSFLTTGIYNIVVLLLDNAGCQQTFSFKKVVVQELLCGFISNSPGGCVPYRPMVIDTTDSKLPSPYFYHWEDGQGNTYTTQIPNLLYKDTGTFELKMKVKDQYGCEDESWDYVKTGIKIIPSFSINKKAICNNEDIKMTNTTPDSLRKLVEKWTWEFGNTKGNDESGFTTSTRDYPKNYSALLITNNNECKDTCMKEDSITIKPTLADFVYFFDTCFSNTGRLKHTSVLSTDFTWFLPGGKTSKDTVIYHKFKPGTKETFKVVAVNNLTGCWDTVKQEISPPHTTSNIKATKMTGCTPQVFKLENFQTRAYRNHWDFGNGDTSSYNDSFRYTYFVPGVYTISHIGWDIRSCPYTSKVKIVVDGPSAGAKIWPDKGCLPLTIQLIDSVSTGKVKRKYWKFEDDPQWRKATNKYDTLTYTIFNMPASGDTFFHIELYVEDSNGCKTSKIYKVRPSGPKAGIQAIPDSRCDAIEFSFSANLDSSSASYPVKFKWELGDGKINNTDRFKYIYEKGGKYKVNVVITDGMGCSLNEQLNLSTQDPAILAKFSANNTSGVCPPLLVSFTESSITDPNRPVISYLWNFGDGTFSTLKNPSKLYTNPGNYDVSLTVQNALGCKSTTTMKGFIKVGGPTAIYSFSPAAGCQPVKAFFKSTPTPLTTVEWDFGDGHTIKADNTSYLYSKPGVYYPKLLLKDLVGCQVVVVPNDSIKVNPRPSAQFNFDSHCLDDSISFINQSNSHIKNLPLFNSLWILNSDTLRTNGFKWKFKQTGNSTAQLIVSNAANCTDTSRQVIRVSKPTAIFNVLNDKICLGDSLNINNESSSKDGVSKVIWLLDKQQAQLPIYAGKGNHGLSLQLTDTFNCRDTFLYNKNIHIGDTAAPNGIQIIRVSHTLDRQHEIVFNKSNDEDFESYNLYTYDNSVWNKLSEIKDLNTLQYLNNLNEPKQSRCYVVTQRNYCQAESDKTGEHCSIHLQSTAQSNSNKLSWNPYGGWPVMQYEIERLDPDGHFALIGSSVQNEFIDSSVVCKQIHYYRIKALGTDFSYSDTSGSKADWQNRLPSPSKLWASVVEDTSINLNWSINSAYNRSKITGYLLYKYDDNGTSISTLDKDSLNHLYKRLHVDEYNYHFRIRQTDDCGDTGAYSNIAGNILVRRHYQDELDPPGISWNAYREWSAGVKQYQVQRMNPDGEFETIAYTNDTVFVDRGTENSCMKRYVYRVLAELNGSDMFVSVSNHLRIKPASTLFIPNAFTPNGNNLNEAFGAKGQYLYDYHIEIYNAWGERVFESGECMATWDGTYKGEPAGQNVYFYRISAKGTDGKLYIRSGTVTLLR